MQSSQIIHACPVQIDGRELFVDLVVLNMPDYKVILGMDWLTKYNACIDYRKKIVVFRPSRRRNFLVLA